MSNKQIFLDAALKIEDRIVKNAVWDNDKCTWKIYAPNLTKPKERIGKWENAGGAVYQGTAGIALFLAETYRVTKDSKFAKTLMGAVNNSLCESERLPLNTFGFHSGRVGIAYASILVGKYLEREDYIKKGLELISPMLGKELENGIDVIGGAGGAIQPLLKIYEITNDDTVLNVTLNLGESLISKANMEPCGWSWGGGNSNYRNLCGYAHGASGIGHAFLELFNLTNSNYYLYVAEQAFLYERQFYNEENNNWPDLRYSELSEYLHYNRINELKEAIRKNELVPYSTKYMSAWCHGAPGIGLSRLRAYELTGNKLYEQECINSCENTISSLYLQGNYSLCHGLFGNAETLLIGSKILSKEKYLDIIEEKAVEGIERFESKNIPWPCGTMNSISDPSLMLGETGIGHFLLRLYDEHCPSILSIESDRKNHDPSKNEKILQKQYLDFYFEKTLNLIDKIEMKNDYILHQIKFSIDLHSDTERALKIIENYIHRAEDSLIDIIRDFLFVEKEKYLSTIQIKDFTKEYLDKLVLDTNYLPDWENIEFCLHEDCKLVEQKYYPANGNTLHHELVIATEGKKYFLLFRDNNKIQSVQINELSYIIFSSLRNASNIESIVNVVMDIFEIESNQIDLLKQKIKEQLFNAYKSGLLKVSAKKNGAFV